MRRVISVYMHWKYEADKNLVKRTGFKWFILRPGGLLDVPGTGNADVGRTHLSKQISVSPGLVEVIDNAYQLTVSSIWLARRRCRGSILAA